MPVGIITKNPGCPPSACGELRLVKTGQNGGSPAGYYPVLATSTIKGAKVAEVNYSGTTAYATYEVINSDPSVQETANFPVAVAFTSSEIPAAGKATVEFFRWLPLAAREMQTKPRRCHAL